MRSPTSPAHDVFDVMFQAADLVSSYWTPMLKGVGRWQLEVSQMTVRQAQATMTLTQRLARCTRPDEVASLYREYWIEVGNHYADANRNIATALVRAAPNSSVLQLPLRRAPSHDTLLLVDSPEERTRKVA